MNLLDLLTQGGPIMYLLLVLSIISLAIILFKFWQFFSLKLGAIGFVEHIVMLVRQGRHKEALNILGQQTHPVAQVLSTTLICVNNLEISDEDIRNEISQSGSKQIRFLESWLRELAVIAQLSPLLGLLGTVIGMISAFRIIEDAGSSVNPSLLAGGIWEALLTTAFGLAIAIPTVAANTYFEGRVDEVRSNLREGVNKVLVAFKQQGGSALIEEPSQ